jgi:hypothetical protein
MALYVAKFIDHRNEVFGRRLFEADKDEAAKDYANSMLRTRFGKGYEIWLDERLVHREIYSRAGKRTSSTKGPLR